jgi:hypothetical protein
LAKLPRPDSLHTDLETLGGYFVLSVFCESLIVDPKPFTLEVSMDPINLARGDTLLFGNVVSPPQSVKLIYQLWSPL